MEDTLVSYVCSTKLSRMCFFAVFPMFFSGKKPDDDENYNDDDDDDRRCNSTTPTAAAAAAATAVAIATVRWQKQVAET